MNFLATDNVCADKTFRYIHSRDLRPVPSQYLPHSHDVFEIMLLLKGNCSYIVESMVHTLEPFDVMLARPGEVHQIRLHAPEEYERIIITLNDSFFISNDCGRYRSLFTRCSMGRGNIIPAKALQNTPVVQLVERIESYIRESVEEMGADPSGESSYENELVIRCAVIELLHTLNRLQASQIDCQIQNQTVLNVSSYINRHLTEDLSLEHIAEHFYISKYYLCRIFKEYMGLTIGQYITQKRVMYAKKLHNEGHTLSDAAALSGFSDYSSFYKAFIKENGLSPRESTRQQDPYPLLQ